MAAHALPRAWPTVPRALQPRAGATGRSRARPAALVVHAGSFWGTGPRESDEGKNQPAPGQQPKRAGPRPNSLRQRLLDVPPLELVTLKKGVSAECLSAMQRTVSGMLGLLSPDQFRINVQCGRESLHRLLTSATMTGYTLHNVENRLIVQRTLEQSYDATPPLLDCARPSPTSLALAPAEVQQYVEQMEARLKELEKGKPLPRTPDKPHGTSAANALMNYLKSLDESQVAALSKPGTPDVEEAVRAMVDSLVGKLPSARSAPAHMNGMVMLDTAQPQQTEFNSSFSVSREYLETLLLWCMCMGHLARSLEHRQELQRRMEGALGASSAPTMPLSGLRGTQDDSF